MANKKKKNLSLKIYRGGGEFGNILNNYGYGMVDMALSTLGAPDKIGADQYKGQTADTFNKVTDVSGQLLGAAAPIAATAVGGPMAGMAVKQGQKMIGSAVNPQDPNAQQMAQQGQQGMNANQMMGMAQSGMQMYNMADQAGLFARNGGVMRYNNGGINMYPGGGTGVGNGQVELDENSVSQNGEFTQYDEPPHEAQNPNMPNASLDNGEMVFSATLKKPGTKETFATLNKINNTNKEDKMLENPKMSSTQRLTAKLMKDVKVKNSEILFKEQEAFKQTKLDNYAKRLGVSLNTSNNNAIARNGGIQNFEQGGMIDGDPTKSRNIGGTARYALKEGEVPSEYKFTKQDGEYDVYSNTSPGSYIPKPGNFTPPNERTKDPEGYKQMLLSKMKSGNLTPEEMVEKGMISPSRIDEFRPAYNETRIKRNSSFNTDVNPSSIGGVPWTGERQERIYQNQQASVKDAEGNSYNMRRYEIPGQYNSKTNSFDTGAGWSKPTVVEGYYGKDNNFNSFNPSSTKLAYDNKGVPYYDANNLDRNAQFSLDQEKKLMNEGAVRMIGDNQNLESVSNGVMKYNSENDTRGLLNTQMNANPTLGINTQVPKKRLGGIVNYRNGGKMPRYFEGGIGPEDPNAPVNLPMINTPMNQTPLDYGQEPQLMGNTDMVDINRGAIKEDGYNNFQNPAPWKNAFKQIGLGAMNNIGNAYDLYRSKDVENTRFDRATASLTDSSQAIRDNMVAGKRYNEALRNASGGSGSNYIANRLAGDSERMRINAGIRQNSENINAGIRNQNSMFNTQIANQEFVANEQNRAKARDLRSNAFSNIGSNIMGQVRDNKLDNRDQQYIDAIAQQYPENEYNPAMRPYRSKTTTKTRKNTKDS